MSVNSVSSKAAFDALLKTNSICLVHFYAPWAQQCTSMNGVIEELQKLKEYKDVKFAKCEAEEIPEVALHYKIAAVPTVIIFNNGKQVEVVNGANAAEVTQKLNKVVGNVSAIVSSGDNLENRLKTLTNKSSVVVFMKGNPLQPRCGFSKTLIAILNETKYGVNYDTFDILEDEEVRQGLKTYSNWPTYPQIYVKGELIGGLDIIKELQSNGELVTALQGQ